MLYTDNVLLSYKAFCPILSSIRNDSMHCLIFIAGESCPLVFSDGNHLGEVTLTDLKRCAEGR